jgi:hypothetical protein
VAGSTAESAVEEEAAGLDLEEADLERTEEARGEER